MDPKLKIIKDLPTGFVVDIVVDLALQLTHTKASKILLQKSNTMIKISKYYWFIYKIIYIIK